MISNFGGILGVKICALRQIKLTSTLLDDALLYYALRKKKIIPVGWNIIGKSTY